jgi:hypothetical protein
MKLLIPFASIGSFDTAASLHTRVRRKFIVVLYNTSSVRISGTRVSLHLEVKLDPSTYLNDDDQNFNKSMVTNDPKNLEGKLVLEAFKALNQPFYSQAHDHVLENEKERKKYPDYARLICEVKDIDHETDHWFELGRTSSQRCTTLESNKNCKCIASNVLIECCTGEITLGPFDFNATKDFVTHTEYSK